MFPTMTRSWFLGIRLDFGPVSIHGGMLGTRTCLSALDSVWDRSSDMGGAGTDGALIGATGE